uniref:Uncharacterized protein n=1 Tax=Panagrolaimus sp. PS1159 TaxID=55785 RepID=A0AC35GNC1_9BILA
MPNPEVLLKKCLDHSSNQLEKDIQKLKSGSMELFGSSTAIDIIQAPIHRIDSEIIKAKNLNEVTKALSKFVFPGTPRPPQQ